MVVDECGGLRSPSDLALAWRRKAIRQLFIPPTVVISAPGLLVGSGMDTELRGFLHAEPLAGAAHWSAHVEVQRSEVARS